MTEKNPKTGPHKVKRRIEADLLRMSIPQVVFKVAMPATLAFMMFMVFGLVDAFWVGKLGAAAMAALSAAGIYTWILYSLGALGEVGVQAIVSQAVGGGKEDLARHAVMAGLVLHTVLALAVIVPTYLFRHAIFSALGVEPAVLSSCLDYIVPFCAGMFFFFPAMVATNTFHALGDTRTPAIVLGLALGLNAILDPFLILGWGPFPRLGLMGAGLATAVAKVLYTGAILWLLRRRGLLVPACLRDLWQCVRLSGRITAIGLPIAANGVIFSAVYLVLIRILSNFGTIPIATLGIAHRIEGVAWFTCVGFSVAASAIAGQHVGAGDNQKAARAVGHVTVWLSVFMAFISVAFMVLGEEITALFIKDAGVVREGGRYLLIIGLFEVFLGLEVVYEGTLGAVGSSFKAFIIATPLSALRVPMAWFLAIHLGLGIATVWWAIALTTFAKGMGLAAAFHFGSWRKRGALVDEWRA